MKNKKLHKTFSTILFLTLAFAGCKNNFENSINTYQDNFENFISIENDKFFNGDTTLFPLMMNYIVQLRRVENEIVVSPTVEYDTSNIVEGKNKESVYLRIRAHFQLIKEMGFNSIRMVGFNHVNYEFYYPALSLNIYDKEKGILPLKLSPKHLSQILESSKEVIEIAKQEGLRVMILLPKPRKQENYNHERLRFIKSLLDTFSENTTVFAYDFFNEPLYFDNAEFKEFYDVQRRKEEAFRLVSSWKKLMNNHAPNQLMTIGFAEPIEVFEWDPTLLPVDFVTFHTYNPLRVPNEIYWYAKNVNKPWMLGETSLPADNDSISYAEQAIFMKDVLQRVINCGGQGLGWWQFQDVKWGAFEHDYTALVNHEGKTTTRKGLDVYGSVKDAGNVLPTFDFKKTGECDCLPNYYNILGYHNYKISGKIINEKNGSGVEGAVIRGWTKWWGIAANTFTDEDGNFELYSNKEFVNFEISAPGLSTAKFMNELTYKGADPKNLTNTELEYHGIHYQGFVKKNQENYSTFIFDDTLFENYKLEAEMEDVILSPINVDTYN